MSDRVDIDDQIFEALLATGWDVKVDAGGNITAERNQNVITGRINETDGSVMWATPMGWALREARILDFKRRAEQHRASQGPIGQGPKLF